LQAARSRGRQLQQLASGTHHKKWNDRLEFTKSANGLRLVLAADLAGHPLPNKVIAPSLAPTKPGGRVKTDRRDPERRSLLPSSFGSARRKNACYVSGMRTFTAVVERDPDTGLFVGYIPGWPGAHSQGATEDELRGNLKELIAMLLEDGDPVLQTEFVGTQTVRVA